MGKKWIKEVIREALNSALNLPIGKRGRIKAPQKHHFLSIELTKVKHSFKIFTEEEAISTGDGMVVMVDNVIKHVLCLC